jgi:DNA-directed RNA polymerase subunit RPC12/RpoP
MEMKIYRCPECGHEVSAKDQIPGYPRLYECRGCGYPSDKEELSVEEIPTRGLRAKTGIIEEACPPEVEKEIHDELERILREREKQDLFP